MHRAIREINRLIRESVKHANDWQNEWEALHTRGIWCHFGASENERVAARTGEIKIDIPFDGITNGDFGACPIEDLAMKAACKEALRLERDPRAEREGFKGVAVDKNGIARDYAEWFLDHFGLKGRFGGFAMSDAGMAYLDSAHSDCAHFRLNVDEPHVFALVPEREWNRFFDTHGDDLPDPGWFWEIFKAADGHSGSMESFVNSLSKGFCRATGVAGMKEHLSPEYETDSLRRMGMRPGTEVTRLSDGRRFRL